MKGWCRMDKLEKVVKGLETCVISGTREDCEGYECPYFIYNDEVSDDCQVTLFSDALALLKAQKPRVMTLEEYGTWTDIPFTERDPVFHEERTKRGSVTCWVNTGVCSLREYGKNDRCWTSRPTDVQRKATPWN